MLELQYRMCRDIMSISNQLVYNDRLRCGTEGVASACLQLPRGVGALTGWLRAACDPERRVVVVDTDAAALGEHVARRDTLNNPGEAEGTCAVQESEYVCVRARVCVASRLTGIVTVVLSLVRALVVTGALAPHCIGLITPFRSQMQLLEELLARDGFASVEANTIDRCQGMIWPLLRLRTCVVLTGWPAGRDWECVILSLVRSNDANLVGEILLDWRRLNVALTRAKHKLIIVADPLTLNAVPPLAALFAMCKTNGWIVPLPPQWRE